MFNKVSRSYTAVNFCYPRDMRPENFIYKLYRAFSRLMCNDFARKASSEEQNEANGSRGENRWIDDMNGSFCEEG